jgi:queuine/archaeosine tRNA-ribosyltransferase
MRVLFLIPILALAACTRQPDAALPTAWARVDGQPVVSGLLDIASLDCKDDMQSGDGAVRGNTDRSSYSRAMVDHFVSCMREHGYVQIKS